VFQPECRLVAVTLPQGGRYDKKKYIITILSRLHKAKAKIILLFIGIYV
jgi:hypothetical protein